MNDKVKRRLEPWQSFLNVSELEWLNIVCSSLESNFEYGKFILNFNFINRKIGKRTIENEVSKTLLRECEQQAWLPLMDTHFVARLIYLNAAGNLDKEDYLNNIRRMLLTFEHGEAIHFYRMLPMLPHSENLIAEAEEILRTNSVEIFAAFSQNNPWPKNHFSESAWNRMVLKSVFMELELDKVVGLHEKNNINLYDSLIQYSKERKAASRKIPQDIWQLLFAYLKKEHMAFLEEYYAQRPEDEQSFILNTVKNCRAENNPAKAHLVFLNRITA